MGMDLDEFNSLRASAFKKLMRIDVFRTLCMIKTQFDLNMEGGNAKRGKLSWTEEETALLFKVVLDYKTAKLAG